MTGKVYQHFQVTYHFFQRGTSNIETYCFKDSSFYPTGHEAQDSNGSSISESQEGATERKLSPLTVNKGFAQVAFVAALRENPRENETSESVNPDKDLKTTINKSDVAGKFCS